MDPEASEEDNTAAMTEAIGQVHTSEITYAARDSDFDGFAIKRGDYLALTEHQLFGTDQESGRPAATGWPRPSPSSRPSLSTIFYGAGRDRGAGPAAPWPSSQRCCPNAEITLLSGGQPVYYYMVSAE